MSIMLMKDQLQNVRVYKTVDAVDCLLIKQENEFIVGEILEWERDVEDRKWISKDGKYSVRFECLRKKEKSENAQ